MIESPTTSASSTVTSFGSSLSRSIAGNSPGDGCDQHCVASQAVFDIFGSAFVVRDDAGWQITQIGLRFLGSLEALSPADHYQEQQLESNAAVASPMLTRFSRRSDSLWTIREQVREHSPGLHRWVYPFRGLVSGRPMASSWTALAGRLRPESFQPFPSK